MRHSPLGLAHKSLGSGGRANAGPIEVVSTGGPDVDRYGRKLRLILQNGRSVGDVLVAEGWHDAGTGRAGLGAEGESLNVAGSLSKSR